MDLEWALNPMTIILIRGGEDTETQKHREKRDGKTCKDWSDVPTSQGPAKVASSVQEPGEAWNRLSPDRPERTNPANTPIAHSRPPQL